MPQIDGLKRYLESGLTLTKVTRSRAEELVRDLIEAGDVERSRAQEWVEDLVSTSRERSEAFIATVRNEVRSQMSGLGVTNLDELARRVAKILERGQAVARKATRRPSSPKRPAKKAPAKKTTTARKAPAKKTTTARKAAAKKTTTARKAPARKAAAAKKSAAMRTR